MPGGALPGGKARLIASAAPRGPQALGAWSSGRITQGPAGWDRAAGLRQWKPRRTPSKGLQYATFPKTTLAPLWWLVLDKNDAEAATDRGRQSDSKQHARAGVRLPREGTRTMRLRKCPEVALRDLACGGTAGADPAP